jgi:hypothetical protein
MGSFKRRSPELRPAFLPSIALGRSQSVGAGSLKHRQSAVNTRGSPDPDVRPAAAKQLAAVQRNYESLSRVVGLKQHELEQVRVQLSSRSERARRYKHVHYFEMHIDLRQEPRPECYEAAGQGGTGHGELQSATAARAARSTAAARSRCRAASGHNTAHQIHVAQRTAWAAEAGKACEELR